MYLLILADSQQLLTTTEGFVSLPFFLGHVGVDSNGWEVALAQEAIEFTGTERVLDENDDLVVAQFIEQIVEAAILLFLSELDVILLQSVQSKFRLVVDIDFEWVLHELLAHRLSLVGQCGRKHHDLLLGWRGSEDLLHIATHIYQHVSGVSL